MLDELCKIRYARFRLEMTAVDRLRLPPFRAGTLRDFAIQSVKTVSAKSKSCSTRPL